MNVLSSEEILDYKKEYNEVLKRHNKAFEYLEDNEIPIEERERWLPEYSNILNRLNVLLNIFEIHNIPHCTAEILGGFVVGES